MLEKLDYIYIIYILYVLEYTDLFIFKFIPLLSTYAAHYFYFTKRNTYLGILTYTLIGRDVPDPDTGILVKFRYPAKFTGYLPDNISVFEIDKTGVKTLVREFKSCLTGLTSCTFICGLPDLFQFYF